ncbi:MAG: response regulator [Bdellovibrio sp.]|nr:response regulator [Bdellovibrio sp.]
MAKILIVDDQKSILITLEALLSAEGHSVVQATNAIDAAHHLTQEPFDMVITDAIMPGGGDGYALTRTIRKQPQFARLPIILLTGKREKSDVQKGIESGANDYIVKPIDPELLNAKVRNLLSSGSANEAVHFSEAPVSYKAEWEVKTDITSISELGLTIQSTMPMPQGKIVRIKSSVFTDIGIDPLPVRVDSCEELAGSEGLFKIQAHFVGLTERELQPLRLYIRARKSKAS